MPIKVTDIADTTIEAKSIAADFIEKHERMETELIDLRAMVKSHSTAVQGYEIERELLNIRLKDVQQERDRYLQYGVELSAQLQFIVAGAARALKIAQTVQAAVADAASRQDIPDVPGADLATLEDIFKRLEKNAEPTYVQQVGRTEWAPPVHSLYLRGDQLYQGGVVTGAIQKSDAVDYSKKNLS